MRITIITIGSYGDVQPYIALGLGLQAAGHNVCLAGYRIQVIWRTAGHYDHVHIGVAPRTECARRSGYIGSFTL